MDKVFAASRKALEEWLANTLLRVCCKDKIELSKSTLICGTGEAT